MKNTQFTDDAPPLYDIVAQGAASASTPRTGDEKRPLAAAFDSLVNSLAPSPAQDAPEGSGWDLTFVMGSVVQNWKRKTKLEEMRATMRSVTYDTLRNLNDPGACHVLYSCRAACASNGLSFDELIQEEVEGHTPLYWAILAHCHASPSVPAYPGAALESEILDLLLSSPLTPRTVADARAALMLNDANALFQTLRTYATFERPSYAESVIGVGHAATSPTTTQSPALTNNSVVVEHISDAAVGTFRVAWAVPAWCKRVKVAKKVTTQWIARGRAWQLTAMIANSGWVMQLKLLKGSAAAPIDGVLRLGRPDKEKVVLRFHKKKLEPGEHIEVKLTSAPGGPTLEYEDSPYLTPEGVLYIEGEFVLEKSDPRKKQ